ncbi:1-Cys peroxiredoxin [Tistlia consotensis]|uniref:Thioredoxin peroxidase n=1 Tax=Tistlia consotensis USBA 355 TaxID=560819 RepID=A0A1Y6CTD7_9PROT|nr:redoxin domain-containing protein [Tistlia consotensis]SMF75577.1 1-Cys peroxiredoxin [Tistlia consotensis USBA 355]SNS07768.1 1-Cys peroxiredoxin [Tistlia consotensis]
MEQDESGAAPGFWPRIGEPAPAFEGRSTDGPVRLADFRGGWLFLLSHPADFTPVCTSELAAFGRRQEAFRSRGCALLALSIDSLYAHLAWLQSIERTLGVRVAVPLLEDVSMAVARRYGMIHPAATSTATIRASYLIDPDGLVQAITWYPLQIGRSVEEHLRLLEAARAARASGCGTPADWQPGGPLLEPPPTTRGELPRVETEGGEAPGRAWYYRPRPPGDAAG